MSIVEFIKFWCFAFFPFYCFQVSARYPVAVALQAALSGLGNVKKMMTEDSNMLLVAYMDPIRDTVNEAMGGTKKNQR